MTVGVTLFKENAICNIAVGGKNYNTTVIVDTKTIAHCQHRCIEHVGKIMFSFGRHDGNAKCLCFQAVDGCDTFKWPENKTTLKKLEEIYTGVKPNLYRSATTSVSHKVIDLHPMTKLKTFLKILKI